MVSTVFTPSGGVLNADDTNIGLAFRVRCVLSAGSNGKLQVTFTARSNVGLQANHCSVGLSSSSTSSVTTTTPVELKFGGVSGFSIAAGASITSDLTDHSAVFTAGSGAAVIVCIDVGSTAGGERYRSSNSNVDTYFVAYGTGLWNIADPASVGQTMTKLAGTDYTVEKVETNASGGTTQTITAAIYTDADTLFSATVAPGAAAIAGGLFANADTFPAATLGRGAVTISGALYSDADSFPAAVVGASYGIAASLLVETNTFDAATVAPGAVVVAGALFADADQFFAGVVSLAGSAQSIGGALYANDNAFYGALVNVAGTTQGLPMLGGGGGADWDDDEREKAERAQRQLRRASRDDLRRIIRNAVAKVLAPDDTAVLAPAPPDQTPAPAAEGSSRSAVVEAVRLQLQVEGLIADLSRIKAMTERIEAGAVLRITQRHNAMMMALLLAA